VSRVAFVVNGDPGSALGLRAQAFAQRLSPEFEIVTAHREPGRIHAIAAFTRFLRRNRPALTVVFDMAYAGVLAAASYRRRTGTPMIIDTGDAIHALSLSMGRGVVGRALTGWLERFGYRTADALVVRGTRHAEWLAKKGISATVIPDGVDPGLFRSADGTATRARLGLTGVMSIGVVGTSVWSPRLRLCYGWDLVEAIHLLRDAPVKGVVIGDGSGIAHLRARAAELGVTDRMVFAGRVAYADLPAHLAALDVCLSTQTNDLPGQVRTTGKLPLYLAAGRFILASRVGEAALVLPEEMLVDYAGVVDRDYPARLADRIRGLLANPQQLRLGESGIAIARLHFDYTVLANRLRQVIAGVLSSPLVSRPSSLA
jgi:glycosyltransferase involved in cell wall biosynthesis